MIYSILKPFVKLCLITFFRKITLIGKEHLDPNRPVIFTSNHPNAFLDPLIFLILQPQKLHFIAGAEWFGKGLKNWLFRKQFNMIPVIRPWLFPDRKVSNDEMFQDCYECLAENGRITIYPEGTSVTVTKIRELKTGAARIKIGADQYMKGDKKVEIIPVGINYSNPRRFQSEVVVNVGSPIDFDDLQQNDIDEKELAQLMTDRVHEKMSDLVLHYDQEDFTPFARQVFRLYGGTIRRNLGIGKRETERNFRVKRDILQAIIHFQSIDRTSFEIMKERIDRYFDLITQYGLDTRMIYPKPGFPLALFLFIVILAPLFAIGFILNALPFTITRSIFMNKIQGKISEDYEAGKLNPAFIGSLTFLIGMGVFSLWYILIGILAWLVFGQFISVVMTLLAGYISGIIALKFTRLNYYLSRKLRMRKFSRKNPKEFKTLLELKKQNIDQLEKYREEFQKTVP